MEWQPIETAPKDGTYVDLWVLPDERVPNATYKSGCWREWALDDFDGMGLEKIIGTPTHWMPLPTPPEGE